MCQPILPYAEAEALALAPKTLRITQTVAHKISRKAPMRWREDIREEAEFLIWPIIVKYDPERSPQFEKYFLYKMHVELFDYLRKLAGNRKGVIPPIPLRFSDFNSELYDVSSDQSLVSHDLPVGWELESDLAVRSLTSLLKQPTRDVMRSAFLDCKPSHSKITLRSFQCYYYRGLHALRDHYRIEVSA